VWLSSKDISTSGPSTKLDDKFLGPFNTIQKVSDVTYRIDLPPTMDINNSFHVSRLLIFVESERRYIPEFILDGTFDEASQQYTYLVHGKVIRILKLPGSLKKSSGISTCFDNSVPGITPIQPCFLVRGMIARKPLVQENVGLMGLRPKLRGAVINSVSSLLL
jgi:hypothetical protein